MSDESRRSLDGREVVVWDGMTLGELSKELGVKPVFIMKKLMDRGIFARLDQTVDIQLAFQVVHDFGLSAIIRPD
jgi:translation initiation factor IF-2